MLGKNKSGGGKLKAKLKPLAKKDLSDNTQEAWEKQWVASVGG